MFPYDFIINETDLDGNDNHVYLEKIKDGSFEDKTHIDHLYCGAKVCYKIKSILIIYVIVHATCIYIIYIRLYSVLRHILKVIVFFNGEKIFDVYYYYQYYYYY